MAGYQETIYLGGAIWTLKLERAEIMWFRNTLRRAALQRCRYRRSIAPTVLAASPNCLATWRTDALSHANPTASSKRLLNGALLGNCGSFSIFTPQFGQQTR